MKKRKGISTRTRFEIFKRDGFQCGYCGTSPIDGPLHVDHVQAVANGGGDEPGNLITACEKCNLGKSSVPLDKRRFGIGDPERSTEHAKQLRQYMAAQKDLASARREASRQLVDLWRDTLGTEEHHENLAAVLSKTLAEFGMCRLLEAMSIVASKRRSWTLGRGTAERDIKYFHGILRRWREGK